MIDVLLIVTMFVVCTGIGLPIARLLPGRFAWRATIAPVLGYGVLAVAVPVAYRAGVSIRTFFIASLALSIAVLAVHARRILGEVRAAPVAERRAYVVIAATCLAATLVMLAPRWAGGDRFSAFQGNTWDTFGYLHSAVAYANTPYERLVSASDTDFVRDPTLVMGQASLVNRPSVHQLYAVFAQVSPGQLYRLHYPFLVCSYSLFVLVALFTLRTMFPAKSLAWCAPASAIFPLGFWGQYILDINAWSHISAVPGLLLVLALGVDIAVRQETVLRDGLRLAGVLAVAIAGVLFLYPEGLVIYIAAIAPVAGLPAIVRAIKRRDAVGLVPLLGILGIASAVFYAPTWHFLVLQLSRTSTAIVRWWEYFQDFFFGRDGQAGPASIDFTGSFFGLYFLTPEATASAAVSVLSRVAIVAMVVGILASVGGLVAGRFERQSDERARVIAWVIASVLLFVPAVVLLAQKNYWPAGKCVSYAAPAFVLLCCLPMIARFTSRSLRIARWLVIAFAAFQLLTALGRTHAARTRGHYLAPYPSVLDANLKKQFPWSFRRFEAALGPETKVLVRVPDVWPRAYVLLFLTSRRIPFAIEGTVNTYFDGGRVLGPLPPPWEPDVEFIMEQRGYILVFRDGRPPIRIVAKP